MEQQLKAFLWDALVNPGDVIIVFVEDAEQAESLVFKTINLTPEILLRRFSKYKECTIELQNNSMIRFIPQEIAELSTCGCRANQIHFLVEPNDELKLLEIIMRAEAEERGAWRLK